MSELENDHYCYWCFGDFISEPCSCCACDPLNCPELEREAMDLYGKGEGLTIDELRKRVAAAEKRLAENAP